jgi:anaerobic selenocysteine-containing dehydrogenase
MKKDKQEINQGPEISRRSFLKISGAVAGGAAFLPVVSSEGMAASKVVIPKDFDGEVDGCCQFCQVRCTFKVLVKDKRVVNVYGRRDNFWTQGGMCAKGQSLVELTHSPHRLLYPLKREGKEWKKISYPEALAMVAERILQVKREFPDDFAHRVVLFAPLWESRESELAAQMALHLAGFPDICSPGDACIGNSATALRICLGSPASTTTLDEILNTRMLILWGANIAEIYPPYTRWLDRVREKGIKILYLDPRRTPTSDHCDEQLMPRPGTDGAFILGLIRILIQENLYDRKFVASHVNGFKELISAVEDYTPARVAKITRVAEEKALDLARRLGRSDRTMIWMGGSLSRYTNSIQTVRAIVALQAITGNLAGPGKGIMNVQGGKPGGDEPFNETFRSPDLAQRLSFRKALYNMARKKVDVLLLNSSYRRYPDAQRVQEAISRVGFVVYRGFFMDEEAKLAHLVIPGTMAFESAGSQYGAQRQVVWRHQAIPSPGETVEDWRFYRDLGQRVNPRTFPAVQSPEDIYKLFRKTAPSWAGLTLDRLQKDPTGIPWPCPAADHPGTRGTLYPDNRFLTPDGKVELRSKALGPIFWKEPEGSPEGEGKGSQDFPLIFTQGKVAHQWQHTYTNWSAYMAQFSGGNYVQVHPETVRALGIRDGDWVYLETKLGKIKGRVRLSELILPGVVWTPSHPAPASPFEGNRGQSINTIIPNYWDEVSAQFNGFGCKLTKA